MRRIRQILCHTENPDEATEAVEVAARLSELLGAKLLVETCRVETFFHAREDAATDLGEPVPRIKEMERIAARDYQKDPRADLDWESGVYDCAGTAESIRQAAQSHDSDLVVLHSERGTFKAALFGSVAETLIEISPCPVLVTRSDGDEGEFFAGGPEATENKKIVLIYDSSESAHLAMEYTLVMAQACRAEIHVLSVASAEINSSAANSSIRKTWDLANLRGENSNSQGMEEILPKDSAFSGQIIYATMTEGEVYSGALDYAEKIGAGLICLGAEDLQGENQGLFGSGVRTVLRGARSALLIARSDAGK